MESSKRFVVVRLDGGPEAQQITIVSSTWLRDDATQAVYATERGSRYYSHVANHSVVSLTTTPVPITVFMYTDSFQHAREMEKEVVQGSVGSSDGTVAMGLPPKRRIRTTILSSDDDEEVPRRPRIQVPTFRPLVTPTTPSTSCTAAETSTTMSVSNNMLVLSSLQELKESMKEMNRCMQEMKEIQTLQGRNMDRFMRTMSSELSATRVTSVLPIKTLQELLSVESKMNDGSFAEKISDQLRLVHGATMRRFVFALLDRVFARKLCLEFTYSGCHNGFLFKRSNLCLFLIEQVLQRPRFSNESRPTVVKVMRNWFNYNRDKRKQVNRITTETTEEIP